MARDLKHTISTLEPMTGSALAILALASGIYTYIGVKGLLDGSNFFSGFAAIAYSTAVSIGIFVFWSYVLRLFPLLRDADMRAKMVLAMVLGSAAIVAMSSWLNAAALAGSAAVEQHLANTVEAYQAALEQSHENSLAAQGLLPDIRIAANRFGELAKDEAERGALTGSSGTGTVVQALTQMSTELESLAQEISASREELQSRYELAGEHLRRMRELVAGQGAVSERSISFAEQSVQVAGIIAEINQSSMAPGVKRVAEDLGRFFVQPAADGGTAELRQTQLQVVESVREAIQQQSQALSRAANEVLDKPEVSAPRFTPISTAEAVLIYWSDFVPSWAGAISIDLLPAVIVFILYIVHSAIRRQEEPLPIEATMTLREMEAALDALRRVETKAAEMRVERASDQGSGLGQAPATAQTSD